MSDQTSTSHTSPTPATQGVRPNVLIIGAGLGGLIMALLLEKSHVPYTILERAPTLKSLGSAHVLAENIAPLFQQLGIYEEFKSLGHLCRTAQMHDENCHLDFVMDFEPRATMGGADGYIVSRPTLHQMLYSKIPAEKIHLGKRVVTLKQDADKVSVQCKDDSVYEADILIGADGANSAVRKCLFKALKNEGKLLASDDLALPFNCLCLVGQTGILDPEAFPELKKENSTFNSMSAVGKPFSWSTFVTKQNTICWMVTQYLEQTMNKDEDRFRASDWGPEAAEAMCEEVRHFPIPNGGKPATLGTLIDLTPKDLISKVVLEEKVFTTWYSGRTVLMGDACHKLSPAGGVGAATAMHDAVCLANWINVLPSTKVDKVERIFQQYYEERFPVAQGAFRSSQLFSKINAKNFTGVTIRYIQRNMPTWVWTMILKKMSLQRPQISFLPHVEDKGTVPAATQPSLIHTQAILEKAQGAMTI